jgi:hypothetical protein
VSPQRETRKSSYVEKKTTTTVTTSSTINNLRSSLPQQAGTTLSTSKSSTLMNPIRNQKGNLPETTYTPKPRASVVKEKSVTRPSIP